jgi:hypothetical protein
MVSEIHHKMEGEEELLEKQHQVYLRLHSNWCTVFRFDSILTAIGMIA